MMCESAVADVSENGDRMRHSAAAVYVQELWLNVTQH